MRQLSVFFSGLILAAALAACESTHPCLEIDGPCVGPAPAATFIVGVDPGIVDRSTLAPNGGYRAVLHVGDTVTLHFVRDEHGELTQARDTIRVVTWTLRDSVSADIVPAAGGSALLIATHVGRIGIVFANGIANGPYACGFIDPGVHGCEWIGAIDVVAR